MYGPPPRRKRKVRMTGGLRKCIQPFVEHKLLATMGMRCALFLFSWAVLRDSSGLQVSRAPGSTFVPSQQSPADLARNHYIRNSRWSADVGIVHAISKPGVGLASSAGQLVVGRTAQQWGPIFLLFREDRPRHARQLIG